VMLTHSWKQLCGLISRDQSPEDGLNIKTIL
jgi:hypothetical protein